MTPHDFIAKWRGVELTERAAAQSHFIDLCALIDEPDPVAADPKGEWFTFEKGAAKTAGGRGWADVWRRGCFGWEYKRRGADLDRAFGQLLRYSIALENPPLLVVADTGLIRVHTNWTNTVQQVHEIALDDLADAAKRAILDHVAKRPDEEVRNAEIRAMLRRHGLPDDAQYVANVLSRWAGEGTPADQPHEPAPSGDLGTPAGPAPARPPHRVGRDQCQGAIMAPHAKRRHRPARSGDFVRRPEMPRSSRGATWVQVLAIWHDPAARSAPATRLTEP